MNSHQQEITAIIQDYPAVANKAIVDFANGIDIVNDHVRVQKTRTGLGSRIMDSLTGDGAKRQNAINENLANGLETALDWLTELSNHVADSYRAIALVNDRVNHLQYQVAEVAEYAVDTRQQFEAFAQYTEKRLETIDSRLNANEHREQVLNRWRVGEFSALSPYAQCHLVLQLLHWGDWGNWYYRQNASEQGNMVKDLRNACMIALAESQKVGVQERIDINRWVFLPNKESELIQVNQYLGDKATVDSQPYIYTASQRYEALPRHFPYRSNAERLVEPLLREVINHV